MNKFLHLRGFKKYTSSQTPKHTRLGQFTYLVDDVCCVGYSSVAESLFAIQVVKNYRHALV